MSELAHSYWLQSNDFDGLLNPFRIREQARKIQTYCYSGQGYWRINGEVLPEIVEYVHKVIEEKYPQGIIPYHSRLNHFQVGGVDRLATLEKSLMKCSAWEKAKSKIDLVVVSVLLDAGSGSQWQYRESGTGKVVSRSEGLAVASFHMFQKGLFSSDLSQREQVDGGGLLHLTEEVLAEGLQVSVGNPLTGFEGRLRLLHSLGRIVEENKELFGGVYSRPGNIIDFLLRHYPQRKIPAADFLTLILKAFMTLWPQRSAQVPFHVGDVWFHDCLGPEHSWESWQPFHKLTQWLVYSLLPPLEEAGFQFEELNDLTALAEYRNGGLLIDKNLLIPRQEEMLKIPHLPSSPWVVEWRALTIFYIDEIYRSLCQLRSVSPDQFPLVRALEGGTWWAGRKAAKEQRANGSPPIALVSDGTVF